MSIMMGIYDHDSYYPGDEYAGEHNDSEWHDSNEEFVEDGNMTDGYDPGPDGIDYELQMIIGTTMSIMMGI